MCLRRWSITYTADYVRTAESVYLFSYLFAREERVSCGAFMDPPGTV